MMQLLRRGSGTPWFVVTVGFLLFVAAWFGLGAIDAATLSVVVLGLYYGVAGASFNLLHGSTGIFSLAQPVFLAVGGFTSIVLYSHFGISPWLSILIAIGISAALALPIGAIAMSKEGTVITALVTLIVAEAAAPIVTSFNILGNGPGLTENVLAGSNFSAMQFATGLPFARILLVLNGLIIVGLFLFARSRFGRWSTALRDSVVAAEASGVPTKRLQLIVFVAAAVIAAPAGVIYAQYALQANTDLFLQSTTLFEVIVVALVGGAARPWGALVGALIMTQLSYHVANAFPGRDGLSALIFGIAFLFVALAMPEGISGTWAKITKALGLSSSADAGLLTARTKI
jgi:branched-chain amino acid transport system permease protein